MDAAICYGRAMWCFVGRSEGKAEQFKATSCGGEVTLRCAGLGQSKVTFGTAKATRNRVGRGNGIAARNYAKHSEVL